MTNFVKSIQSFSIAANAVGIASVTINEVNPSRSIIIFNGITTNSNTTNYNRPNFRLYFTDSTTITATKDGGSDANHTINGMIIEFTEDALLSNIQHGTITLADGQLTNNAIISEVDLGRAALFYLGKGFGGTVNGLGNNNFMCTRLSSSTTVTSERVGSLKTMVIGFCVAEFSPAFVKSVQHRYLTLPANEANSIDTISAINPDNTLLCIGEISQSISSPNAQDIFTGAQITDSTTVSLSRGSSVSSTRKIAYDIVEFLPGILKRPIQRGIGILNNITTQADNITAVDLSRAFVSLAGFKIGGTNTNIVRQFMTKIALTNATTVTSTVNVAGSTFSIPYTFWQVLEFTPEVTPEVTLAKAQIDCQATHKTSLQVAAQYKANLSANALYKCTLMEELND